jgi:hypothetical protein
MQELADEAEEIFHRTKLFRLSRDDVFYPTGISPASRSISE